MNPTNNKLSTRCVSWKYNKKRGQAESKTPPSFSCVNLLIIDFCVKHAPCLEWSCYSSKVNLLPPSTFVIYHKSDIQLKKVHMFFLLSVKTFVFLFSSNISPRWAINVTTDCIHSVSYDKCHFVLLSKCRKYLKLNLTCLIYRN